MSIDQRRKDVEKHQKEIARLQLEKSREEAKAAADRKKAHDARLAAGKTKSTSTLQSKLREAERHESSVVATQKKLADLEAKIAREYGRSNDAQKRLSEAQIQDTKKLEVARKREHAASAQQLSTMQRRLTQQEHLHRHTAAALQRLQELPERLTVLFLASNPLDQQQLRLDEEARSIAEMVRKSEHRDAVRLESRWAVRPLDVLQAINECKPGVVHFSGHGAEGDEIIFQDGAGNTKAVSKEAMVQTIVAGSSDVQLVFFNACFSQGQAAAVVEHVPCAIGMNAAIGDEAARVFAAQFYSGIGFGLSVQRSFLQAKAALMLEGIPEHETPELFTAEGVEADDLVLVKAPRLHEKDPS